ncbi:hypothetical protein Bcep1808_4554 [Burkholderia vietnamiensis G4]|uniref:Uncharacterized protein n=1 Tax=Burkholderia vietnamiensis (strain G4 / LMG 22486) TaxID=269482 RepID=A4JML4_BURVG|nr:hypothetical protein Bcep1808_4554 [Burkholderia vietnamiensis G4]
MIKRTCSNCSAYEAGGCHNSLGDVAPGDYCEAHNLEDGSSVNSDPPVKPEPYLVSPQALRDGYMELRSVRMVRESGATELMQMPVITPKGWAHLELLAQKSKSPNMH